MERSCYILVRFLFSFLFFQRNRNILSFTIDTISLGTLTLEIEYIKLDNPKDLIINIFYRALILSISKCLNWSVVFVLSN